MERFARSSRALPMRVERCRGFTLLEVLIALAILAVALTAVIRAVAQSIDLSAGLRDRTLALWVAQDRLAKHQIQKDWPPVDNTDGTQEMADRQWQWTEKVSATDVAEIRRIDIEIRAVKDGHVLGKLTGFLRRP